MQLPHGAMCVLRAEMYPAGLACIGSHSVLEAEGADDRHAKGRAVGVNTAIMRHNVGESLTQIGSAGRCHPGYCQTTNFS